MIIELGVIAAATAIGSMLAARAVRKKRTAAAAAAARENEDSAESEPDPFADLPVTLGDVIQSGHDTRWPRVGILVRSDEALVCAILLSEENGEHQAVVAMAPPDRNLYWLVEKDTELPRKPPARLEIDGCLLDRKRLLPVQLESIGDGAPDVGERGRYALYEGTVGDAAVVLISDVRKIWYGTKLTPNDFDRLGQGRND